MRLTRIAVATAVLVTLLAGATGGAAAATTGSVASDVTGAGVGDCQPHYNTPGTIYAPCDDDPFTTGWSNDGPFGPIGV